MIINCIFIIYIYIYIYRFDSLKKSHTELLEKESELNINISSLELYINELQDSITTNETKYNNHEKKVNFVIFMNEILLSILITKPFFDYRV